MLNISLRFSPFMMLLTLCIAMCAGCNRNSCRNVACPVNQQCIDGGCYCADGLEGADCSIPSHTRYTSNGGTFNVTETCYNATNNFFNYTCYILPTTERNRLIINNLFGFVPSATAFIRTDGNTGMGTFIEIPQQQQGAFIFSGTGNYNDVANRMTINFNYTYNGGSYQCTHTFYKQ
ncbi:MAG: hypothetical protein NZM35_07800 [Chitinophagales bacterium]|nr:hypothetical protein [Chitinophagales bacterium]MDW8419660.1 hypothetical protein [Chitinophagales bacterium]